MPAKSKKQWRFMQAIAHGWKPSGKKGPSKSQAAEYISGQSPKGLPETKKTAIDFPLIGSDKRAVDKKPRNISSKKPKLTPEKLSQIASQQGVKRVVYKSAEEVLTSLLKAFERRDDYTLVDPREYYGALQTVSDEVMGWMKDATKGMKINDAKEHRLPVKGATLKIRKLANDMYSGWIIDRAGDINHLFDRLTLPALATQVMAAYEVYDKKEEPKPSADMPELRSLKDEITRLNGELKAAKSKSEVVNVEERIKSIIDSIDKLTESHEKISSTHDRLVERTQTEINSIHSKLKDLKGKLEPEEAAVPEVVTAHKVGEPGKCEDCNASPCVCYGHLPRPAIEVKPNGTVNIIFKSEWSSLDRLNFLKSMKLVVDRRRGQSNSK